MAIPIEWIVTRLEVIDKDGLNNVAIQACFDIKATDENLQGFAQGDVSFGSPDPTKFTPIDKLSKEQVISWIKSALGNRVKEFEDRVIEQIERQRSPKPKSITLSWMPTEKEEGEEEGKEEEVLANDVPIVSNAITSNTVASNTITSNTITSNTVASNTITSNTISSSNTRK